VSYHIIDISTNGVALSVRDGQLVCRAPDDSVRKLPMEDIGAILINCFSAQIHNSFLIDAAKRKMAVILCECFRPVSVVLPVQRASDTMLTRAQIQAPMKLLRDLWGVTIDAKCANQYSFAERIAPNEEKQLADFRITMNRSDLSKEGNCARIYWGLFGRALSVHGFHRLKDDHGLNGLLNYGYAVLLLRAEQKLLACGLDPLYGMGHYPRERSLPLAYDIMEPFRVAVDEMVFEWAHAKLAEDPANVLSVDNEYKKAAQGVMSRKFAYGKCGSLSLDEILEQVVRSYRAALTMQRKSAYKSWIRRSSRWDG